MDFDLKNTYLTRLGSILWYIVTGLKKWSECLTGFGLILWYTGLGFEKQLDTELGLILLYIELG